MRKGLLSILHFFSCLKVSTTSGSTEGICVIKGKRYALKLWEKEMFTWVPDGISYLWINCLQTSYDMRQTKPFLISVIVGKIFYCLEPEAFLRLKGSCSKEELFELNYLRCPLSAMIKFFLARRNKNNFEFTFLQLSYNFQ